MDLRVWVEQSTRLLLATSLVIDQEIAVEAYRLPPPIHKDPIDRLLIATARLLGASLLPADEPILQYPHVLAMDARR